MPTASRQSAMVLVVEDERELADIYSLWLSSEYEVKTAYSGEDALNQLDESVDVVLLDRLMPGLSGDQVLPKLREINPDCFIVMVTAVDPDFDILDLGFDGYVTKPVNETDLHRIVEHVHNRGTYSDQVSEYYRISAKLGVLEGEKSEDVLQANEDFTALKQRAEALRREIDSASAGFDDLDFRALLKDLSDG